MRLRLRHGRHGLNAIYFSADPTSASVQPGDLVDVAFVPQVNEYRGERSVQLNVLDIRPSCAVQCPLDTVSYRALRSGTITAPAAAELLPDRKTLATVWRYLSSAPAPLTEAPVCLCRKIVRWSGKPLSLGQLLTCLDIFADVSLLQLQQQHKHITVHITAGSGKADLNQSQTMQRLLRAKES